MHAQVVGPPDPDAVLRLLGLLGQVVAVRGPHPKLARRDQGQGHADRVGDPARGFGVFLSRVAARVGPPVAFPDAGSLFLEHPDRRARLVSKCKSKSSCPGHDTPRADSLPGDGWFKCGRSRIAPARATWSGSVAMVILPAARGRRPDLPLILARLAPVLRLPGLRLAFLGVGGDLLPAVKRVVPAAALRAGLRRFFSVHACRPPARCQQPSYWRVEPSASCWRL